MLVAKIIANDELGNDTIKTLFCNNDTHNWHLPADGISIESSNATKSGLVRIFQNNAWGTVCVRQLSDEYETDIIRIACRQAGLST